MGMTFISSIIGSVLFSLSLVQGATNGSNAAEADPRQSNAVVHLALLVDSGPDSSPYQHIEDTITADFSNQRNIQLVERAKLELILQEQRIALGTWLDGREAVRIGRLAQADCLLLLRVREDQCSIRLVEVATGRVTLEEDLKAYPDVFLTVAAVRQRTLEALKLRLRVTECLTIGIASFVNRSGTDRSDTLNIELQKAIRQRLRSERWTTVLERQYPNDLLREVNLARAGWVGPGVEQLPPADAMIFGVIRDAQNLFDGRVWDVNIEVSIRLRQRTTAFTVPARSDNMSEAADRIVEATADLRNREAGSFPAEPEKELWRRHALYLMPRPSHLDYLSWFAPLSKQEEDDVMDAARAWENILLLDPNNVEAKLSLGICLVSPHWFDLSSGGTRADRTAREQVLRGSQLVEEAVRANPSPYNALTFAHLIDIRIPERGVEISEFVLSHREMFPGWAVERATSILDKTDLFDQVGSVVQTTAGDPSQILSLFSRVRTKYDEFPDRVMSVLERGTQAENEWVRFCAEWQMAEVLCYSKGSRLGLLHYDRAIEAGQIASRDLPEGSNCRQVAEDICFYKINAALRLGDKDSARQTALDGARHFIDSGLFNSSADRVLTYCVTEALDGSEAERGLSLCNAYLTLHEQHKNRNAPNIVAVIAAREQFRAILSHTPMPDFSSMHLVKGSEIEGVPPNNKIVFRMAVSRDKIFWTWRQSVQGYGPALVYSPAENRVREILHDRVSAVASCGERVFCGGPEGLFELGSAMEIVQTWQKQDGAIPCGYITDLCEGDGRIYMIFREPNHYGVAVLDPTSERVSVLAPTSRDASPSKEPVWDIERIGWDVVNHELHVSGDKGHHFWLGQQGWRTLTPASQTFVPGPKGWQLVTGESHMFAFVVSEGAESLIVRIDANEVSFEFPQGGQLSWQHCLPAWVGEPAWDADRIWVPTYLGLYEVSRRTAESKWLAHQTGIQCLSVLRHRDRLYVATNRGLYWCSVQSVP